MWSAAASREGARRRALKALRMGILDEGGLIGSLECSAAVIRARSGFAVYNAVPALRVTRSPPIGGVRSAGEGRAGAWRAQLAQRALEGRLIEAGDVPARPQPIRH